MVRVPYDQLHRLAEDVLLAAGTSAGNACVVASALVAANADGLGSHGVSRLPGYSAQVSSGRVNGTAIAQLNRTANGAFCVDAMDGFAYPAIKTGLDAALQTGLDNGIVGVAIRNSHHSGVAGHRVETIANSGFLGLMFSNSPAALSPPGGSQPLFGTNPIALACPRQDATPLVIDLSLSQVARGRVALAASRGEPIPVGWALDQAGQSTTDAASAMSGSMLPIGGDKGALLALMVELLSAALTGSHFGFEANSFFSDQGGPARVGQFFILINPAAFSGPGFAGRVETLLDAILDQQGTRLPGERRLQQRADSRRHGIEVSQSLYRELQSLAGR